jgi:AcrR family transcriptional regulator
MAAAPAPVRRGRPRAEGLDQALLDITLELAGEVGIHGMSMDDLAQRAGVSKATIYRRWPSKERLVLEALNQAMRPFELIDTGSLRGDLDDYLGELARRMNNGKASDVLPDLIASSVRDANLRTSLDEYIRYRRQPLATILNRALERGQLDADSDIEVLIDAFIGPFVYRRLLTSDPLDDDFVDRLIRTVLPACPSAAARTG